MEVGSRKTQVLERVGIRILQTYINVFCTFRFPYFPPYNSTDVEYRDAMGSEETAGSVLLRYAPSWLMSLISFGLWASPVKNEMMTTVDEALASAQKAAATLIKERKAALQIGEDETDVDLLGLICECLIYLLAVVGFRILIMDMRVVKANADSEAKLRLTDSELVAQITTL